MAKFRFPLQPVLRLREQAEQAAQRALAEQIRAQVQLEESLRTQHLRLSTSSDELRSKLVGRLDLGDLRLHAASALAGARHANQIVLELAAVHRHVDTARQAFLAARQQRMAIERLRERRFEAWQARLNKAEDAMLDDIACRPRAPWPADAEVTS